MERRIVAEMARSIRATPAYADAPILVTSGVSESALKAHASLLSAFLRKPFKLKQSWPQ